MAEAKRRLLHGESVEVRRDGELWCAAIYKQGRLIDWVAHTAKARHSMDSVERFFDVTGWTYAKDGTQSRTAIIRERQPAVFEFLDQIEPTEGWQIYQAVLHDPFDDGPRLALADWAAENGFEERAAEIRAAVSNPSAGINHKVGELKLVERRGFVESVVQPQHQSFDMAAICRRHPVICFQDRTGDIVFGLNEARDMNGQPRLRHRMESLDGKLVHDFGA